jgi:hypothetical protein
MRRKPVPTGVASALAIMLFALAAVAQQQKHNILVIMGDDIGYWNASAYNRGSMGYRTPNIDRIANEGAILTDYYGQQSCTAGRAAQGCPGKFLASSAALWERCDPAAPHLKAGGFVQGAPDDVSDRDHHNAEPERNPPSPRQ